MKRSALLPMVHTNYHIQEHIGHKYSCKHKSDHPLVVGGVQTFKATRNLRHMEAVMNVLVFAFVQPCFHSCTLGAPVSNQTPPYPLYTKLRAHQV